MDIKVDYFFILDVLFCYCRKQVIVLSSTIFSRKTSPCAAFFILLGMNTEAFYKSKPWLKKRAAILRRDGFLCQNCLRYGRRRDATTVHHKKHLDDFPELALIDSNLVSLCESCHNKEHPEKGGGRRYPPRSSSGY